MIFNSIDFLLFFPAVYLIYLKLPHRGQNFFLLGASYFFYGYWDYRFLSLLIISTIVDYSASLGIKRSESLGRKKLFLFFSIFSNLSILGFFKYFNFFTGTAAALLKTVGLQPNLPVLNIILPLGISFYTFQTMSYTVDVYRGQLEPADDFWDFALFVTFFPQLVAGPIERATNLLPQVLKERTIVFQELQNGAFLVLFGFFKKLFIADNLAMIVDPIFDPIEKGTLNFGEAGPPNSPTVLFGTVVFTIQIYCDFAGYSDIARGISKFMGFELMRNFNTPLLAQNVNDFWRRWHISFMSWLRDYVYFSIGNKNDPEWRKNANNLFTYLLSGLWHGASWSFAIWGFVNGLLSVLYKLILPYWPKTGGDHYKGIIYFKRIMKMIFTLILVAAPTIYFRSQSFDLALLHTKSLFTNFGLLDSRLFEKVFRNIALLLLIEIYQNSTEDEYAVFRLPVPVRSVLYVVLFYAVTVLGNFNKNAFIYFVF